jgi:hypothetical protein
MRSPIVAIFALTISFIAESAWSCSCMQRTEAQLVADAKYIFVAKVVGVIGGNTGLSGPLGYRDNLDANGEVLLNLKGLTAAQVVLRRPRASIGTSCDALWSIGDVYLIYAKEDTFDVYPCSGSGRVTSERLMAAIALTKNSDLPLDQLYLLEKYGVRVNRSSHGIERSGR